MDIIQRNFLKLLKCGAFGQREQLEPMSAWKWKRLYQLSQMHDVTPWVYEGILTSRDDFFLQIRPELMTQWKESAIEADTVIVKDEEQKLTNPLLNHKLQQLSQKEGDSPTPEAFKQHHPDGSLYPYSRHQHASSGRAWASIFAPRRIR